MWVHFYFVLLYYIHSIKSHFQIFFNSFTTIYKIAFEHLLDILYRLISYNIQVNLAPFFSISIPFFVTYYCIIQYINNIVFEYSNSIFLIYIVRINTHLQYIRIPFKSFDWLYLFLFQLNSKYQIILYTSSSL